MLRGLTTVNFFADDVPAAVKWYSELLGIEPYFIRPEEGPAAYVEFRIGTYSDELGIMDRKYAAHPTAGPTGSVTYWHVDDVAAATERALAAGATAHDPIVVREAGFVTGSVLDPFGNILGLMHSPHWVEVHGDGPTA
jgi:predicted enzyme related to lactoylglutathione lyase